MPAAAGEEVSGETTIGGMASTVHWKSLPAVPPRPSSTFTVTSKVPTVVAVPVTIPRTGSMVRPVGSPVALKVNGVAVRIRGLDVDVDAAAHDAALRSRVGHAGGLVHGSAAEGAQRLHRCIEYIASISAGAGVAHDEEAGTHCYLARIAAGLAGRSGASVWSCQAPVLRFCSRGIRWSVLWFVPVPSSLSGHVFACLKKRPGVGAPAPSCGADA